MNYIMIHLWGALGASIATVLSQLVVDAIQIYYIKDEIELKDIVKTAWNYFKAGIIMFAVCLIMNIIINKIYIEKTHIINCFAIIVEIVIGILTYFTMLVVEKDQYLYTFIEKIKGRILNKKEN